MCQAHLIRIYQALTLVHAVKVLLQNKSTLNFIQSSCEEPYVHYNTEVKIHHSNVDKENI